MDEELGDELIALLLPQHKGRGRPRADDWRTLDGILWVLRWGVGEDWSSAEEFLKA
jgi:hypothetical protein